MSEWTAIAARTQLPPSPEVKAVAADADHDSAQDHSRLRSLAKYSSSFKPQALACSLPVSSSYADVEHASRGLTSPNSRAATSPNPSQAASLGAVAGQQGIALFRVTRPESPLLVFSASNTQDADIVSSLSFQQSGAASDSFYLAAAKGASALVWDASGHSPNPLRQRLRVDSGNIAESRIKSLNWKPNSDFLAATTASTACLWDLRVDSAVVKPSLRFGVNRGRSGIVMSPNVQIACSDANECAVMDAAGRLRVFDIRKTERARGNANALYSVAAFLHAGIGVSYFPTSLRNTATWLTWGLDRASNDASVRIWTSSDASSEHVRESEEYWFMEGALNPNQSIEGSLGTKHLGCQLVGQCTTSKLACARVCLAPMKDSFVTIGFNGENMQQGWRAEVWKLMKSNEGPKEVLHSMLSFTGGNEARALGLTDTSLGALCAAELALADTNPSGGNGSELLLCSLSESGFITTHVSIERLFYEHLRIILSDFHPFAACSGDP